MPRFYPVSVVVEGHTYRGDWTILMGDRVCVRSAFGSLAVECGKARPEVCAVKTLERIVRADQKRRADHQLHMAREMAKLRKRRDRPHA